MTNQDQPSPVSPPSNNDYLQYEVNDLLQAKGVYYICGEIDEGSLVEIHQNILMKHLDPNWKSDISIFINSVGGEASEGWALVDLLDCIRMDVRTYGMGVCASLAAILLAAGTPGKRFLFKNAAILIHQFSASAKGTFSELTAAAKDFELEHQRHIEFWRTHSKFQTIEEVEENLLNGLDVHLTADQAIDYMVADQLVQPVRSREDIQERDFGFIVTPPKPTSNTIIQQPVVPERKVPKPRQRRSPARGQRR